MKHVTRWDFERAVQASSLPAPSRHILLTLATRADANTGNIPADFSPSHARLAADTGLSRRTVIDHMTALETAGWLRVDRPTPEQQRAKKLPNRYRLRIPKAARPTPDATPETPAELVQELHTEAPTTSAAAAPHNPPTSATAAPGDPATSAGAAHGLVQELHTYQTTNNQKDQDAPRPTRGRGHTRERTTAAELNATASRPDAYRLVASWAETLTEPVLAPDRRALAKHVDELLAQGATLPTLRAALDLWATRGRTPGFLPHAYREASRAAREAAAESSGAVDVRGSRAYAGGGRPSTTDQRIAAIQELREQWRADGRLDDQPQTRPHLRALPGAAS